MTTSVSRGGILRALNKEDGPRRTFRQTRVSVSMELDWPLVDNARPSSERASPKTSSAEEVMQKYPVTLSTDA